MKKYICFLLFVCFLAWVKGQNFNRNYNFVNGGHLIFFDIHATDTGYYALGTMSDTINDVYAGIFSFVELNGDIRWVKNYARPDTGCAFVNIFEKNNQFFVCSSWGIRGAVQNELYSSLWLLDLNGEVIWQKIRSHNNVPSIVLNVFKTDTSLIFTRNSIDGDFEITKLNQTGDLISSQSILQPNVFFNLYGSFHSKNGNVLLACSDRKSVV